MQDIETLKWRIGTIGTVISAYLAYLQLQKSGRNTGADAPAPMPRRRCPGADAPAPRDLAPRGTEDLQNTLKIIKTAISRDEFDFALEVSG